MEGESPICRQRARDYAQQHRARPWKARFRANARDAAMLLFSMPARMPVDRDWVIFPYYHHVLDDERQPFARQLKYLRRFGQFVSLDDALSILSDPAGPDGRYFCVSFDDGFRNCLTNALPILVEHDCPATFFVPTDYIGIDLDRDWETAWRFYRESPSYCLPLDFLDWDDCRRLQAAGMTIGSHTCTHARLADLEPAQAQRELVESKARIEAELGGPCRHFAPPKGRPGRDFFPQQHAGLARKVGYRSLLTTRRGSNAAGTDPYLIRREEFLAGEDTFALKYFLSRKDKAA